MTFLFLHNLFFVKCTEYGAFSYWSKNNGWDIRELYSF